MIQFLFPNALWGLLLIGAIPFLYRYRALGKNVQVGSLELWKQIAPVGIARKDTKKKKKFDLLPIVLTILAYSFMNLRLAEPVWIPEDGKNRSITVVLDCSASMQTQIMDNQSKTSGKTVFEVAIEQCRSMLKSLDSRDHVRIILYPPQRIFSGNPDEVERYLSTQKPSCMMANFSPLFESILSDSQTASMYSQTASIYFVTDGTKNTYLPFPGVTLIPCGLPSTDNVGIVGWKSVLREKNIHFIFAVFRNFSDQEASVPVKLISSGQTILQESLVLKPDQRYAWSRTLEWTQTQDGKSLCLELQHPDNFTLDNRLTLVREKPCEVWLEPSAPVCLKTVLEVIPGVEFTDDKEKATLSILRFPVEQARKSNEPDYESSECETWLICRGTFAGHSTILTGQLQKKPEFLPSSDRLLWAVYPDLLDIPASIPLRNPIPQDSITLLETAYGPIMSYTPDWLYIGFSLRQSGWAYLPSFPIFWQNVFQFYAPNRCQFIPEQGNLLDEDESDNKGKEKGQFSWPPESKTKGEKAYELSLLLTIATIASLLALWNLDCHFDKMAIFLWNTVRHIKMGER